MGYCALVVCLVWSSLFFVIAGIGSVFYNDYEEFLQLL